jgi:two-component system chemotaxis sensor kinase CheA
MDPLETIKQTYFQECEELLLALEEGLLAIERGEADEEVINAVFRAVHSIKGGGGAFGFEDLVAFAHIFETVMDRLRSGQLTAAPEVTAVLLRAGDVLSDHVKAARSGSALASGADEAVKMELAELSGEAVDAAAPADFEGLDFTPGRIVIDDGAASVPAGKVWQIRFVPQGSLYAKASEPYLLLRELASLGDIVVEADLSRLPTLDAFDTEQAYLSWSIRLAGAIERQQIEEVFEFVSGDCDLDISELKCVPQPEVFAAAAPEPARISAEQPAAKVEPEKKEAQAQSETAIKPTIRVDLDKVDRLVNLVGELVITQAMLGQRVHECRIPRSSPVGDGLSELEHLLRELQESVMAIRTQPVKSVFQRMPRLVRELAAQTGKKVRLELEGEGTEVDKTVIERLGEPLTHMIRNAVDHGLESPEDRTAAGKPEEGTVTLSAEHRGGRIVIEVSDDGRGINRRRVREKAVERGLISPAATLSDEEIDNLIFMPGFSTASQISNISGRGVGMDVVRRNIVDLGGRISIASMPKQGSRFSLTLPLTLAVLDGMVVAVGAETLVLPLTHIIESLKPRPSEIQPFGSAGRLLNVRGSYVPLVNIAQLLGIADTVEADSGVVILVESQGAGRLALGVDSILGQHQVVIKSFETNYQHIDGIAAATILGDGRVALILDVDGLVARCRGRATPEQNNLLATGT